MKAAVLEALNTIVVKDIPEPKCGDNDALLKVKACAVCGSDIRIYHYGNDRVKFPTIMGHELAGEIIKVGKNVDKVKVGDRVAVGADVPCGKCHWCQNGMGTNCRINYAVGYQFAGGFQEIMLLNQPILDFGPVTKIPDGVTYDQAAIAEPLACAINGLELANFSLGQSLGIIGLGPIGCMMLELSKVYGTRKVIAAQRSKKRLEMAKPFLPGARFVATESENLVDVIMKETDGEGLNCIMTTAGTVQSHVDAIKAVAHRGYVNLFGGLKNQPLLEIDSNLIHYKECYVMGSHGSLPRHHQLAMDLIAGGFVNAQAYISKSYPLEQIQDAFNYHESREGLKVTVNP